MPINDVVNTNMIEQNSSATIYYFQKPLRLEAFCVLTGNAATDIQAMYNEVSFARGSRFSEEKLSVADLCQAVQKLNGGLIKQSHTRTCPVPGSRQRHGREPQNIIKLIDQKREPLARTGDSFWHSD